MASPLSPNDPSSFSLPDDCVITQLHLSLEADFATQVLKGSAVLQLDRKKDSAKSVLLDTRDLKVHNVFETETKKVLEYSLGSPVLSFGSKLEIQLPDSGKELSVTIEYETSPKSTALQWLAPEQTAGKVHPYLFSQCQAIHARSLVPCQDSPGVKMPYTAQITCPSALVALMSAVKLESNISEGDGKAVHKFDQKVPIPSYLIAVVIGALESREIGPRSKVWSEKEMVEAAAYEFAETEKMLKIAEDLLGPYVWGVYDLLVLPPSFPYGGMENPCLTFVTPTLLAGDRSLALVVAHEISHSWTGNLVTNKNPEHFWLNEGHTVFVERKIACGMHGEKFRHFEAAGGWEELKHTICDVFGVDHPYTKLVPKLVGVDPDDAFSTVPYEKGSALLFYLEQKLGGPEVFEPFLKAYIENFKYKSITSDDWKTFLYSFFSTKKAILDEVDWDTWFYATGMPPVKPDFDTSLVDQCVNLANKWTSCSEDAELQSFQETDLSTMSSFQIREFLSNLLEEPALSVKKLEKLQNLYKFDEVKNSEIRFRWLRLCLKGEKEDAIPKAVAFVNEQGRLKFVRPIYRDLYKWEKSRNIAVENYKKNCGSLHPLTETMIGKELKIIKT